MTLRGLEIYRGGDPYEAVAAYNTAQTTWRVQRMRPDATTDDYRNAVSGEGGFGSLGYDWSDKPHRLIYDLCGEIDYLREQLEWKLIDDDTPRDRHILIGAGVWVSEGWWARDEQRLFEGGQPKEGWAIEYNHEFGEHVFDDEATHWMPMPTKPTKE